MQVIIHGVEDQCRIRLHNPPFSCKWGQSGSNESFQLQIACMFLNGREDASIVNAPQLRNREDEPPEIKDMSEQNFRLPGTPLQIDDLRT